MKVQIIQLDPEDDQVSARDKIRWVKAPRVLLVWPRRDPDLNRRLDLILLSRAAKDQGAQLGLVTFNPHVQKHAEDLGIPVFEGLETLPAEDWGPDEEDFPVQPQRWNGDPDPRGSQSVPLKPSSRRGAIIPVPVRFLAFALAILSVFAMGAILIPEAQVVLTPSLTPITQQHTLFLQPVEMGADEWIIPLERHVVRVNGDLRDLTTGQVDAAKGYSRGTVAFTNVTDEALFIPAGTGVRTAGTRQIRFVTTEEANLPAEIGAQGEAAVRAVEPGVAGNVGANEIQAIEGPLGFSASVTNDEPTAGGTLTGVPGVSAEDRRALEGRLTGRLLDQAAQILQASLEPGYLLLQDSLEVVEVLERQFDQPEGAASETLGLHLELDVEAYSYGLVDIEEKVYKRMTTSLPSGEIPIPNSMAILERSDMVRAGEDQWRMEVLARQQTVDSVDLSSARDAIAGRDMDSAKQFLKRIMPQVKDPQIQVKPSWFPRLPWLSERINLLYDWER